MVKRPFLLLRYHSEEDKARHAEEPVSSVKTESDLGHKEKVQT